jgi:hypothetical protein
VKTSPCLAYPSAMSFMGPYEKWREKNGENGNERGGFEERNGSDRSVRRAPGRPHQTSPPIATHATARLRRWSTQAAWWTGLVRAGSQEKGRKRVRMLAPQKKKESDGPDQNLTALFSLVPPPLPARRAFSHGARTPADRTHVRSTCARANEIGGNRAHSHTQPRNAPVQT